MKSRTAILRSSRFISPWYLLNIVRFARWGIAMHTCCGLYHVLWDSLISVRGTPTTAKQLRFVDPMSRLLSTMKSKRYLFVRLFSHNFDNRDNHSSWQTICVQGVITASLISWRQIGHSSSIDVSMDWWQSIYEVSQSNLITDQLSLLVWRC